MRSLRLVCTFLLNLLFSKGNHSLVYLILILVSQLLATGLPFLFLENREDINKINCWLHFRRFIYQQKHEQKYIGNGSLNTFYGQGSQNIFFRTNKSNTSLVERKDGKYFVLLNLSVHSFYWNGEVSLHLDLFFLTFCKSHESQNLAINSGV